MAAKNPEMGKRLKTLRGERPLREISSRVPCSPSALKRWEDGRVPNAETLKRLAQIYEVDDPSSILAHGKAREDSAPYGFPAPPALPDRIPLLGKGSAGPGVFNVDGFPVGRGLRTVSRPYDVHDKKAFAVTVDGDSMAPRYEDREIVICSPAKEWNRSGDYCVVVTIDDGCFVKRVREHDGQLILSSLNAAYDTVVLPKSKVRNVFKIVWKKEK